MAREKGPPDAPPPIFGSWNRIYIATIVLLVGWIALFRIFTVVYHLAP